MLAWSAASTFRYVLAELITWRQVHQDVLACQAGVAVQVTMQKSCILLDLLVCGRDGVYIHTLSRMLWSVTITYS